MSVYGRRLSLGKAAPKPPLPEALVRNWDFTNPYLNGTAVRGWNDASGTGHSIQTGGIYVTGNNSNYYFQMVVTLSALVGKKYTLSILADDQLESVTFTMPSANGEAARTNSINGRNVGFIVDSASQVAVNVCGNNTGNTTLVQAIMLEEGETQSLAIQEGGIWVQARHQNDEEVRGFFDYFKPKNA